MDKEEKKKIKSLIKNFYEEFAIDGKVYQMAFSRIMRKKDKHFALFEIREKE
ncbi:MAG: hypothetical protein QW103_02795 [Candidatus Pacearchaeota archaeon]